MSKFNTNDKVKRVKNGSNGGMSIGDVGLVVGYESLSDVKVVAPSGYIAVHNEDNLELVESNNTIMTTIKEKFTLAFKSEPEKSFRKAGITNGDDFLTADGQNIFLSWLLKKYGADFKKEVVDGLLTEMEKESN